MWSKTTPPLECRCLAAYRDLLRGASRFQLPAGGDFLPVRVSQWRGKWFRGTSGVSRLRV